MLFKFPIIRLCDKAAGENKQIFIALVEEWKENRSDYTVDQVDCYV